MRRPWMFAMVLVCAVYSPADAHQFADWEIRPFAGYAIPTGAHHGVFNNAVMSGIESSVRLTSEVDLVGSFAWQPSRGKYSVSERYADVWIYNFGVEHGFRDHRSTGNAFAPFVGGGIGGRAYDFRSSSLNSFTCYSGYVSGGASYERGWSSVRAEVRDNLFCYKSPIGALDESAHNEIGVLMGIGFRF